MDGSSLPPSWGSYSGRAVLAGLLCVLLLLLVPQIAQGQTEKPPTLQELQSYLLIANEALTKLVPLSALQETRIVSLQSDLGMLSTQLTDSQRAQGTSEQGRLKAVASLGTLSTQYGDLLLSFNDYRTEMQKQVADLERARNFWRIAGIGGGVVAMVAVIVAIAR
jgi:hypothetical protein